MDEKESSDSVRCVRDLERYAALEAASFSCSLSVFRLEFDSVEYSTSCVVVQLVGVEKHERERTSMTRERERERTSS